MKYIAILIWIFLILFALYGKIAFLKLKKEQDWKIQKNKNSQIEEDVIQNILNYERKLKR